MLKMCVSNQIIVYAKFLPPPNNQIYSRFWYAFSLFLRKFHSVNPFDGNFWEPGQARFAEKKMEFPSQQNVFYSIFVQIRTDFEPVQGRASAVYDERTEWTCSWKFLCSKTWNPPPYGGGNFVSFNIEKAYHFRQ